MWGDRELIPTICHLAAKNKKITEDDIAFLFGHYDIYEISEAINELNLKIPESFFEYDRLSKLVDSSVRTNIYNYENLMGYNMSLLGRALSDYQAYNKNSNFLPELSDIFKSNPNGSSEESKIHAFIIKYFKQNNIPVKTIYEDYKVLDEMAQNNAVLELLTKFSGGEDYYFNKLIKIDGKLITPYNLYREKLYWAVAKSY